MLIVNFDLMGFTNAGLSEWATFDFSRQIVTLSDGSTALAVADPDAQNPVDLSPQVAPLSFSYAPRDPNRPPCGNEWLKQDLGPKDVIVGAGFSKLTASPNISFQYGKGQESTLGIGVEAGNGTFTAGGTDQKSSDDTQDWGTPKTDSTYFKTVFRYGRFGVVCGNDKVHARWWMGGATHTSASSGEFTVTDPTNNCVHEDPGSTFTKHQFSQYTFTAGANLSGVIGIDLSAETGWSTNAQLSMKAPPSSQQPAGVSLCGLKAAPARDAKKLEFIPA